MDIKNFLDFFRAHQPVDETAQALGNKAKCIHWKGLVGSSRSICAAATADQVPGNHVFILSDKEDAAYFLNDLQGLYPDNKRILFYPASYKVPYQLEQTDNANVVARAEVLERITQGSNNWVITYPNALFEKIPTQKKLVENTLKVQVSSSYSIDFLNELLLDYHFDRVDFVYEPGQFSIRGGIVDVFSYSHDLPFRIEFFGDEVDSIRTFDPSTQLSEKTHQYFFIVPNIQGSLIQQGVSSFFEFIGKDAVIWLTDLEQIEDSLKKEYDKALGIFNSLESTVKFAIPSDLYLHPTAALSEISELQIIEWGPKKNYDPTIIVDFDFIPQPSFNKNFD
jgi:transcription-repair coupling factor (superfamily II helicase)